MARKLFNIFRTSLILLIIFVASISSFKWDWDYILGDEEETTERTEKRWNEDGVCDHDVLTIIILKFILETQKQMKNESALQGLPTLDPFKVPRMYAELEGTTPPYRVTANITEIVISGLSKFSITGIHPSMMDMTANVSILLEKITITAKYHFKGWARFGIVPIPIYAKGRIIINSTNVNTGSFMEIGFNDDWDLVLTNFDFHLDIHDVRVEFKGLTGVLITKRWYALMNSIGLKLLRKMEPRIHERLQSRGILGINKALKEMEYDWDMWQDALKQTVNCYFDIKNK